MRNEQHYEEAMLYATPFGPTATEVALQNENDRLRGEVRRLQYEAGANPISVVKQDAQLVSMRQPETETLVRVARAGIENDPAADAQRVTIGVYEDTRSFVHSYFISQMTKTQARDRFAMAAHLHKAMIDAWARKDLNLDG
jgi:hypothetical protein